jgi:hypothetical protein
VKVVDFVLSHPREQKALGGATGGGVGGVCLQMDWERKYKITTRVLRESGLFEEEKTH